MELILLIQALVLGIVEGLTEFLPVSSTGHLIIAGDAIGFTGARAKTFEIFIQLGAILGVVWHYRVRLLELAQNAPRPDERRFLLSLLIAFLPAALVGVLTHAHIKAFLFNPLTVAGALVAGGVAILIIERAHREERARVRRFDALSYGDALKVGVAQMFALFPGVSRSGATIMGGLLAGLSRTAATEFSFFLAIPTMFAATLYELAWNLHALRPEDAVVFGLGFVAAFATAMLVIRGFLVYVSHHSFRAFAWYRIGFGLLVLVYFW